MTGLTPEEADRRSQARARISARRIYVLAALVVFIGFILAFLLQRQQESLEDFVQEGCLQRQASTRQVNAAWQELARIDADNPSLPDDVRVKRIRAYAAAQLAVPSCPAR